MFERILPMKRNIGDMTYTCLGFVAVDSGQVMVADPCYIKSFVNDEFGFATETEDEPYTFSYTGACSATLNKQYGGELGNRQGVASATAYGDGVYPVYQVRDRDGIRGLFIDFSGVVHGDEDDEQE